MLSLTVATFRNVAGCKVMVLGIQSAPLLTNPVPHDEQVFAFEHVAHFVGHVAHPICVGYVPAEQLVALRQIPTVLRLKFGAHKIQEVAEPAHYAQGNRQLSQTPRAVLKY